MKNVPNINASTIERYRGYLKLLASSQLDSLLARRVEASDIVQQTLLDAVAKEGQYRGSSNAELVGWLKQILANNIVDAMRYHGRAKRDVAREDSLDQAIRESFRRVDALVSSEKTPSQRVMADEQLLRLPAALEQLTADQRDAIVLHHLQGLKLYETGKRMGKSESAVCGLLYRGLKQLYAILAEGEGGNLRQ